jgi:hypothetical protein
MQLTIGIISFLYFYYAYILIKKFIFKDKDILNPGLLFPLIIIIYYQLRISFIQISSILKFQNIKSGEINPAIYQDRSLLMISLFILLSLFVFSTLYKIFSSLRVYKLNFKDIDGSYYFSFAILILCLAVRAFKVNLGYQSYGGESIVEEYNSIFNYFLTTIGIFFSLSYLHIIILFFFDKSKDYLKVLIFLTTILIVILNNFFLGGGIDGYVLVATPFFIIFHYLHFHNKIRLNFIIILLMIISFIFLVFAAFFLKELSRNIIMSNPLQSPKIFIEIIQYSLISIANRFHGADSMLAIIYKHDFLGYFENFNTFKLLLIGLIPRFMWFDKPDITLGSFFNNFYWLDDPEANLFQTTAFLLPGEFYINFGFIGVIIGFAFLAIFLSLIYNSIKYNFSIFNLTFVSFFLPNLIRHEYSFASYILGLIKIFFIFYIFYLIHKFILYVFYNSLK